MSEETVGQRLKFLIGQLELDVRSFCKALDISETTVRNYFSRGNNPNAEFLMKLTNAFGLVNLSWLLTGNGEPFLSLPNENNQAITGNQKFFRSPVVGTSQGPAYQENNTTSATADVEALKNKLALVEQENEHLKAQLATKDALLTSKEETLALLRASFNRPN